MLPEWSPPPDSPPIQSQTPGFGTCLVQCTCAGNNVPPQNCWTQEPGSEKRWRQKGVKIKQFVTNLHTQEHTPVWSGWRRSIGCQSQRFPRSGPSQLTGCHFHLSSIRSGKGEPEGCWSPKMIVNKITWEEIKLTPLLRGLYTRHPSKYGSVWHAPLWRWR